MMKTKVLMMLVVGVLLAMANIASADIFGAGDNQFAIGFVTISGDTNPASGYGIVNNDYRMGTYEITNDQWTKFTNIYGIPTGEPLVAYSGDSYWIGTNVPTNNVSWYEAAQFVNWLNTSTGHQAAYKFTGIQGESMYMYELWDVADAGYNANNPFRNSNAFYFIPTEDEWVKAAYWNSTNLQTYATIGDLAPTAGVDTNCRDAVGEPWDVGNGSEELNGTVDMMGNTMEWMEGPLTAGDNLRDAFRLLRGGSYRDSSIFIRSSWRNDFGHPNLGDKAIGFRVASVIPCGYMVPGDLDDNCMVDIADFAVMAYNWLVDCNVDPSDPACVPIL